MDLEVKTVEKLPLTTYPSLNKTERVFAFAAEDGGAMSISVAFLIS